MLKRHRIISTLATLSLAANTSCAPQQYGGGSRSYDPLSLPEPSRIGSGQRSSNLPEPIRIQQGASPQSFTDTGPQSFEIAIADRCGGRVKINVQVDTHSSSSRARASIEDALLFLTTTFGPPIGRLPPVTIRVDGDGTKAIMALHPNGQRTITFKWGDASFSPSENVAHELFHALYQTGLYIRMTPLWQMEGWATAAASLYTRENLSDRNTPFSNSNEHELNRHILDGNQSAYWEAGKRILAQGHLPSQYKNISIQYNACHR